MFSPFDHPELIHCFAMVFCLDDNSWRDNDDQELRFETWREQVIKLAKERAAEDRPLRVVLLEVGAGPNAGNPAFLFNIV